MINILSAAETVLLRLNLEAQNQICTNRTVVKNIHEKTKYGIFKTRMKTYAITLFLRRLESLQNGFLQSCMELYAVVFF